MTTEYFRKLNYTLANEDTTVEMNVLRQDARRVICVAGSGARVLPLFAKMPARLSCVDLCREQLWLAELRIETARILSLEEYLQFWGYPRSGGTSEHRRRVMSELMISDDCRFFFKRLFDEIEWGSLLYCGRWERTFAKISALCRRVMGPNVNALFQSKTLAEHSQFMASDFARLRWDLLVFLIGNSSFFNAFLYGGHFPRKNTPGSHRSFYKNAYDRIFSAGMPQENFFLQLTLFGEVRFPEGNPVECHPEVFAQIQKGIRSSKIDYLQDSVVDYISTQSDSPADFVSLSDVPSYFDNVTSIDFLQRMRSGLAPEALVVARYYLRVLSEVERDGYLTVTQNFQRWIEAEKTQMYHIDVFQRC
jgi:S-adenosylmethionine-diacylglycerol 3-amino-3-carboxypropyl transferase